MYRKWWILIFCLISVFKLAAAGQDETAPAELTIWDFKYNDARTRRVYTRVDRLFTDQNIELDFEHIGFEDEEYIPALRTSLLAGTAPDIFWLHQGAEFAEFEKYFEPLGDFIEASDIDFKDDALATCYNNEGVLKALPVSFQGMGWYYNKELFSKAGLDPENPPMEWESFLDACEKLKDKGITPIASGNNKPLTTDFIRRSLISAFLTKDEMKYFYKQGRGVLFGEYRTIMQFCLTLRKEGYLNPDGIFRSYFNYAPDSFSSGDCAMILGLLSDIAHWKDFSDNLGKNNVGYFPNLIHPDMVNPGAQLTQQAGLLIGINKESKNKEIAAKYLKHLFSEKAINLLVKDLGMLMPIENIQLPKDEYPVLFSIENALNNTSPDIEYYSPSYDITGTFYRYDKLLINSMEIGLDDYLKRLYDKIYLY